jgi:hypothetical protein
LFWQPDEVIMSNGFYTVALGVVLSAAPVLAQSAPAPNVKTLETTPSPSDSDQARQDREWLTAYMLAHQGYRLDHMEALEDKFNRMTPSQLRTLTEMYKMKHENDMRQSQLIYQAQQQAAAMAIARNQRQQALLDQDATLESQGAMIEQQRLNEMHREAFVNMLNNRSAPYGYGPGYGYGYGAAPYYHPFMHPFMTY